MGEKAVGRGRPSKYRPSYCDLVIEEMTAGKSLTAVAAEIGVCRDTIREWSLAHPEFFVAVQKGKAKCAAWWEEKLREHAGKGSGPGGVAATIFGLKNMAPDDWRETKAVELTGKGGGPIETSETSAKDRLARFLDVNGGDGGDA